MERKMPKSHTVCAVQTSKALPLIEPLLLQPSLEIKESQSLSLTWNRIPAD